MSNRKAQNSILFLTTLSVYLGIVLVGGSPSVFAQAALTPRFEIATEFEADDDLDKKPDDENGLASYAAVCQRLAELAVDFTERNRDKFPDGAYSFDYSIINDPGSSLLITKANAKGGMNWGGFSPALGDLGKTIPWAANPRTEKFHVTLSIDGVEFSLRTAFQRSSTDLEPVAAFYNQIVRRRAAENSSLRVVYLNTEVSHETDRLIVVSRLPRASIDEDPAN